MSLSLSWNDLINCLTLTGINNQRIIKYKERVANYVKDVSSIWLCSIILSLVYSKFCHWTMTCLSTNTFCRKMRCSDTTAISSLSERVSRRRLAVLLKLWVWPIGRGSELATWTRIIRKMITKMLFNKGHYHTRAPPYCVQRRKTFISLRIPRWSTQTCTQTLLVQRVCHCPPEPLGTKQSCLKLSSKSMIRCQETIFKFRAFKNRRKTE